MALGWFLIDIKKLIDEATLSGNAGAYMVPLGGMLRPPNIDTWKTDDPEFEKLWPYSSSENKKKKKKDDK